MWTKDGIYFFNSVLMFAILLHFSNHHDQEGVFQSSVTMTSLHLTDVQFLLFLYFLNLY